MTSGAAASPGDATTTTTTTGTSEPPPRCLVIGGTGALSRVICATLARRGARVALTYHRSEPVARELCASLDGARAYALDASVPGAVAPLVEAVARDFGGGIDALVYAAALGTSRPGVYQRFEDIDEAGWDLLMAVNVRGAFSAAQAFVRCATASGARGGNVVLMSSIDGAKPVPASAHYATSKGALVAMARSLAKDFGPRNIRVNAVAPGVQEGGISAIIPDDLRKEYLKHCGLKRVGKFEETAEVVAWLALANRYVTGRTLGVDGGL